MDFSSKQLGGGGKIAAFVHLFLKSRVFHTPFFKCATLNVPLSVPSVQTLWQCPGSSALLLKQRHIAFLTCPLEPKIGALLPCILMTRALW